MGENKVNIKKICSLYVSEWHLVTMILPYIVKNKKEKIITILEEDLTKYMNTLLDSINIKEEDKKRVRDIRWKKSKLNMEIINENIIVMVNGSAEFIEKTNAKLEILAKNNKNKTIKVINCFEVPEGKNIQGILSNYTTVLNTSGERDVNEVFDVVNN